MYLTWNEKTVTDFSDTNIERMYATGYVFTRKGKGDIQQTRSLRVDLHKFELSSENRRVLARTSKLGIRNYELWDGSFKYDWQIGKMAKDFYNKFGGILRWEWLGLGNKRKQVGHSGELF